MQAFDDQIPTEARQAALMRIAARLARCGGWCIDLAPEKVWWSDEMFAILEMPKGEEPQVGEALSWYPDEWRPLITEAVNRAATEGVPFDLELEIVTRSARRLRVRAAGEAERDADGRIVRVVGVFMDISERHAAEERFRLLSRATSDAIWDWDFRENKGWWNDGFTRLFGYDSDQGPEGSASWVEFIHPEDAPRVLAGIQAVIEGPGDAWEDEFRFRCADGSYRWALDRGHIIRDAEGKAIRMVGGMTDLTDRVASREKLRKQAEFIDQASDAILEVDLEGRILFWNQGAERIYGYSSAEAMGQVKSDLLQADRDEMLKSLAGVVRDRHWVGERDHVTNAGERVHVLARWSLLTAADGTPRSVLIIDTDVTERRKIEQQFLRSQRMESIGTLAGGIAHDLNNALAPILLGIEVLRSDVRDPMQLELLDTIELSAKRGADMVRQVLSFARGVEGRRVDLNVRDVLEDVAKIVRDTFPKNIEVQLALPPDLWALSADPTQLHQVLLNLCLNARDAMPHGGPLRIEVHNVKLDEQYVRLAEDAKTGPHIAIEVEDRGHGMPGEVLEKIFDPFFTTKGPGRGTGLGLSSSLAIVRSHGGFIRAYSEPGKGSRFRVYLPANPVASPSELERAARTLPRGRSELILVVDDETSVGEVTKVTLESFGYRVLVATDGADAVAQFASRNDDIALVLTDMMMPIMDGSMLIQILRRMRPTVRIIAVSGLSSDGRVHHVANLGVRHFLPKPFTAEILLSTIRSALDEPTGNGAIVLHETP